MTDPNQPNWERTVLEKVALKAIDEQRRARQWGVLFKLLWFTFAFLVLAALLGWIGRPDIEGGYTGGNRYPTFDFDDPALASVERILLSSEPFRFTAKHRDELAADARLAGKTVQLIDGELTSWYGSRAIEGIDYLRGLAEAATRGV